MVYFIYIYKRILPVLALTYCSAATAQQLTDVISTECVSGDCQQGRGVMEIIVPTGKAIYDGHFEDGEFNGHGRLTVPLNVIDETVYVGNWRNGKRDGRGKYWNGKGNLYIGQWLDDIRHGQGSYFYNLPSWKENQHSEYWLKENTENYSGGFKDDLYYGQGTYRWINGNKYVGGYFANDRHGPGVFYYKTGSSRKQLWEYGEFVR